MNKIKVLVADDLDSNCVYYKAFLDSTKECECVGISHNEAETLCRVKELKPDIILLDMQMDSTESGVNITTQMPDISPDTKIIILTVHDDSHIIYKAMSSGADNYCIKDQPLEEILQTIISVYNGETNISSNISKKLINEMNIITEKQNSLLYLISKLPKLSPNDIEIIKDLCRGESIKQIADKRFVEAASVRTSISRILKKLEYQNKKNMISEFNKLNILSLLDKK